MSLGEEELGEQTEDDEEDGEKTGELDIATVQEDIFSRFVFEFRQEFSCSSLTFEFFRNREWG